PPRSSEKLSLLALLSGAVAVAFTAPAGMAKLPPRWASVFPPGMALGRTVATWNPPPENENWFPPAAVGGPGFRLTAPPPTLILPARPASGAAPARGPTYASLVCVTSAWERTTNTSSPLTPNRWTDVVAAFVASAVALSPAALSPAPSPTNTRVA